MISAASFEILDIASALDKSNQTATYASSCKGYFFIG
jgi:hypothetical protein